MLRYRLKRPGPSLTWNAPVQYCRFLARHVWYHQFVGSSTPSFIHPFRYV